jgi:membrane associated rhomboid family serine protease
MIVIIIAINVILSLIAFSKEEVKSNLLFNPFAVKHNNQWWRVISHAFIHADFIHLFFNMYVLFSFGSNIEIIFTNQEYFNSYFPEIEFWGQAKGYFYLFALYLGGILFATLPAFKKNSENPGYNSLGASGAVSAIVFAYIVLLPTTKMGIIFLPGIAIPSFLMGVLYLWYEAYMDKRGGTYVAHDAHFWGAIFGGIFIFAVNLKFLTNFLFLISDYVKSFFQ